MRQRPGSNRYRSKTQIAYDYIKGKIVSARFKPGETIVISGVARDLGMSLIPVREALQRLEAGGFVIASSHRSPRVSDFRIEDLREVFDVRALLEARATELALARISSEKISTLEGLVQASLRELEKENFEKLSVLDRKFHGLICEESGNRILWETIKTLWDRSDRMLGVFALVPGRARESCDEHRLILDAIRRRDSAAAMALVAAQKRKTMDSLSAHLAKEQKGRWTPASTRKGR